MVVRICSQFRPGEKIANEPMKGILPIAAIPLATHDKFGSATPISKNLSGNFSAKSLIQPDSFKFAVSATTRWSFSPANTKPSPKPARVDFNSLFGSNIYFTNNFNPNPRVTFFKNERVGLILPDSKRASAD